MVSVTPQITTLWRRSGLSPLIPQRRNVIYITWMKYTACKMNLMKPTTTTSVITVRTMMSANNTLYATSNNHRGASIMICHFYLLIDFRNHPLTLRK